MRLALTCLTAALLTVGAAQGAVRIGVIVSATGPARAVGAQQSAAVAAWAERLAARGGVFGTPVEVLVRDDAGSVASATELTSELAEAGVVALVCCTTTAAAHAVSQVAEGLGVLHLSPVELSTQAGPGPSAPYWSFALWPSEVDALSAVVADAYERGRATLALFTTGDAFGDAASAALAPMLDYAGMRVALNQRFTAGASELRPEALLVAASQPGAVVVWASAPDTATAVAALRARGYEGLVYGRSVLAAPGAGDLPATSEGLRLPLPPALVADVSASGAGCAAEAAAVRDGLPPAARGIAFGFVDALNLLAAALEQLYVLQVPADAPAPVVRQALRDAAVGLPARCAGSGSLDLREGSASAVSRSSLLLPELRDGAFRLP